jgi:hypothetical protein
MRHTIAVVGCLLFAACQGQERTRVRIDLTALKEHALAANMPIDRILLTVTAPHLAEPIAREVDAESGAFSLELDAGADVRFEIEAQRLDLEPGAPTYWGRVERDLAPREEVDLVIPVFPAGGLAGEVRLYDGKPIPPDTTLTLTAQQPLAGAPAELVLPVSSGPLLAALPVGGWELSIEVVLDGVRYLPLTGGELLFVFIEQGVVVAPGVLYLAPSDYCQPVAGVYPDADQDGSPCNVDCADMTSEWSSMDHDGDQVSTCDGDCDDQSPTCVFDCFTDHNTNGIPDCRETCSTDLDFDRVCDLQDNCPTTPNRDQTDSDADNVGDACDPDRDGDSVDNPIDNCPEASNSLQVDADQDGFGWECDEDDAASSCTTDDRDLDGDSVMDCKDQCLSTDAGNPSHGFGLGVQIIGQGKVPVGLCTTNGTTPCDLGIACNAPDSMGDLDQDDLIDQIDDCLDADFDLAGYEAAAIWTAPARADGGSVVNEVEQPKVAFHPSTSAAHLVWATDNMSSNLNIWVGRIDDPVQNWGNWQQLTFGASSQAIEPAVAVRSSGAVHVVWASNEPGNFDLYWEMSPTGLSWTSPTLLFGGLTANQKHPAIAVAGFADVYLAWEDDRNGNVDIYFARSADDGVNFDLAVAVHGAIMGDQLEPVIAVDPFGDPWIAWTDQRADSGDIYVTRGYDHGGAFAAPVRVDDDTGTATQSAPTLAFDQRGELLVAWEDTRPGHAEIRFSSQGGPGGLFGPSREVTGSAGAPAHRPVLAVDRGTGPQTTVVHLAWSQDDSSSTQDVFAQQSGDGGVTWQPPRSIAASSATDEGAVSLGVDPSGRALVVWQYGTVGYMEVRSAWRNRGCPRGSDCDDSSVGCARDCIDVDGDLACRDVDCNDFDSKLSPFDAEVCDFEDNDCNGLVDDMEVGPVELLIGGMEDGATEWTPFVYSGSANDWATTTHSFSGPFGPVTFPSTFFGTDGNAGAANENEDSGLLSPMFSPPADTAIGLTFAAYSFNEGGCPGGPGADGEEIEVVWPGSNPQRINVCGDPQINAPYSGQILHPVYDLSMTAGQTDVQLRFHLNTNGTEGNGKDDGWYIDDVRVYYCP